MPIAVDLPLPTHTAGISMHRPAIGPMWILYIAALLGLGRGTQPCRRLSRLPSSVVQPGLGR